MQVYLNWQKEKFTMKILAPEKLKTWKKNSRKRKELRQDLMGINAAQIMIYFMAIQANEYKMYEYIKCMKIK